MTTVECPAAAVETWRPVVGYEDAYEVSDWGRVRSLTRRILCRNGTEKPVKGRTLRQHPNAARGGYLQVGLWQGNQVHAAPVHQLVLAALPGSARMAWSPATLDGNPINNRLENLRYATRSETSSPLGGGVGGVRDDPAFASRKLTCSMAFDELAVQFGAASEECRPAVRHISRRSASKSKSPRGSVLLIS